jgi:hypothetical protein
MELDDVKALWVESNRRLEASMRLNTALLQRVNLQAADTHLARLARGITFELIANVAAVALLGSFMSAVLSEPRFLIPAIALDVYAIALVIAGSRQLAALHAVDLDEPVVAVQQRLERLRLGRVRTTLATLLFAPLMWVPLMIVAARGFLGVDLYANGGGWLAANALFGLAVIPLAVVAARRFGPELARWAPMRAATDAIAGYSLTRALNSLDALRRFEEN